MKKRIFLVVLILLCAGGMLFSVDFGGLVYNQSTLTTDDTVDFGQKNVLSAWFNTGTENSVVFSLGGNFTFSYTTEDFVDKDLPARYSGVWLGLDLYDFRLTGNFERDADLLPRVFGFELGRYRSSDFTSRVFNHTLDGIRFDFIYPFATVRVDTGVTALVSRQASTVIMSKLDAAEASAGPPATLQLQTGPKRFVGMLQVEFPSLFERHVLDFSLMAQEDLRGIFYPDETSPYYPLQPGDTNLDDSRGGLVDTQYFMLGMNGPIVKGFYYSAFGVMNTGRTLTYIDGAYQYTPVLAMAAGGSLRYYNESLLFTSAEIQFVYSSGDADSGSYYEGNGGGKSTTFIPVSVLPVGTVLAPKLGNIFYANASYSLKPLSFISATITKTFQTKIDYYALFRSTPTSVAVSGIDSASDALYLGSEIDLALRFRPLSDVGVSFVAGLFFPGANAFLTEYEGVWFSGTLTASMSW